MNQLQTQELNVIGKNKITQDELNLYNEFKRTEAALHSMAQRMNSAKKKFWGKVKVRLDDFDHMMQYNPDTKEIYVFDAPDNG